LDAEQRLLREGPSMGTRGLAALLTAAVLVTSMGCFAPVSIESRVDPTYRGSLSRIFVLSHLGEVSELFGDQTQARLEQALFDCGLEAEVVLVDPLVLDEREYAAQVARFSPDSILVLKPTGLGGTTPERVSTATVDASLLDVAKEKRFWRATIRVKSGDVGVPMGSYTAQEFCDALIQKLHEDGLIMTAS
jgi:hypothetical protein